MRLRIRHTAHRWLWMVGAMWLLAACSSGSEDPDTGSATVAWQQTTMTAEAGVARLRIADDAAPGLRWSAEITSGDWASFGNWNSYKLTANGQVGTNLASRLVDVYYQDNNGTAERTLTVRFTFEGREAEELSLRQPATGSSGGTTPDKQTSWAWPELPEKVENANFSYVTHYAPVYDQSQGKELTKRNFTLCFDRTKRASWWVAYPMHAVYLGSSPRPDEPWTYDPKIESSWQANLALGSYSGAPVRGHQVANADRNANTTMQYQTFYCSNSTPQNYDLNGGPWMRLESKVRNWKCSDTLYVVTGAYWDPTSSNQTTDRAKNVCPVPTHYFKVLARTVKGNVRKAGDRLGDYRASELQTIGFWVENKNVSTEADSWVMSVEEIEQKTGFVFFPTLPKAAKQQKNKSQWF